ncbi:MAG: hypothetical protein ACFFC3_11015 [Candidatus Odinarchaeota archaeon]
MYQDFVNTVSKYSHFIRTESRNSWNKIDFSANEPDIIQEYLTKSGTGVDYLNASIASRITKETRYSLKFASIFCHQKPRIKRTTKNINKCIGSTSTESCELGDLVVNFYLLDTEKEVIFSNAHIFQAKCGSKPDNKLLLRWM